MMSRTLWRRRRRSLGPGKRCDTAAVETQSGQIKGEVVGWSITYQGRGVPGTTYRCVVVVVAVVEVC